MLPVAIRIAPPTNIVRTAVVSNKGEALCGRAGSHPPVAVPGAPFLHALGSGEAPFVFCTPGLVPDGFARHWVLKYAQHEPDSVSVCSQNW